MSNDQGATRSVHVTLELEVTTDYKYDHAVAYIIGEAVKDGLINGPSPESMLSLDSIKVRVIPRKGE
jgi:hypothetical protein